MFTTNVTELPKDEANRRVKELYTQNIMLEHTKKSLARMVVYSVLLNVALILYHIFGG
jgi:hypothetical protein